MRIANYLRPDCVALRQRADSLTGAVQQMVTLLNGTDNLTDTAVFAADVRARLALGGVCVGNGLAIPHAKSTAVRQLQLAALTLDPPLPCDTPDGKPLDLLVMIAAPAEANDLHVQVLAELATLFLDTDFCACLRESETPEAFCRAISAREEQDAQEPPSAPSDAAPGTAKPGYQLLAVTACPTGIAHTYLAAEALQQAAQARGLTLKVETNGAAGVNDELTDDEIQAAECVIVAVDRSIPLARFVGKRLVYASAGDAVRDADRLLEKAVSGKAPVYRGGHAFRTSDWKELGREYYGHLMSGISHMLPFVVAGGVMLALSLLLQHLFGRSDITTMMTNVGNAAFRMMYPVLAAFITYSIADRPGFMPGLMGGYLAQLGTTTAPPVGLDLQRVLGGHCRGLCCRSGCAASELPVPPHSAGAGSHQNRAAGPAVESAVCRCPDGHGHQSAARAFQCLAFHPAGWYAGRQPSGAGHAAGRHDGYRLRRADQQGRLRQRHAGTSRPAV